jgi:HD-GYP domain-containing protein (c-di-GMP phosphodiesterase class II)
MKTVTVDNLPEGSYIDKPVYLDEHYILLSPDIPVSKMLKQRLKDWSYSRVYTDGSPVESPPGIATPDQDEQDEEQNTAVIQNKEQEKSKWEEAVAFYYSMCDFMASVFDRYLKREELNINEITEKVKTFIEVVKSQRDYILRLNEMETKHSYLVAHSVKTTVITLAMANTMKLPPFKQIDLGIASLLHEIGMTRIPENVYQTSGELTAQQRKAIAAHTVLGFRILKDHQFSMQITRAVLEHHERENGSGYPRGITADKISFYAKIIAVACSYVAIVSDRPHRSASDGHSGMLDLLKNTGKQYNEQIIRVLVYTLSIYPVGTYILLSNGNRGLVVKTDPEKPRHPVIRLLIDENGNVFREQSLFQTKEDGEIQISRPLMQKEIEEVKAKI